MRCRERWMRAREASGLGGAPGPLSIERLSYRVKVSSPKWLGFSGSDVRRTRRGRGGWHAGNRMLAVAGGYSERAERIWSRDKNGAVPMLAIQLQATGGPEVLNAEQVPPPEPGPREVRVRMEAIGV